MSVIAVMVFVVLVCLSPAFAYTAISKDPRVEVFMVLLFTFTYGLFIAVIVWKK